MTLRCASFNCPDNVYSPCDKCHHSLCETCWNMHEGEESLACEELNSICTECIFELKIAEKN